MIPLFSLVVLFVGGLGQGYLFQDCKNKKQVISKDFRGKNKYFALLSASIDFKSSLIKVQVTNFIDKCLFLWRITRGVLTFALLAIVVEVFNENASGLLYVYGRMWCVSVWGRVLGENLRLLTFGEFPRLKWVLLWPLPKSMM